MRKIFTLLSILLLTTSANALELPKVKSFSPVGWSISNKNPVTIEAFSKVDLLAQINNDYSSTTIVITEGNCVGKEIQPGSSVICTLSNPHGVVVFTTAGDQNAFGTYQVTQLL